MIAALGGALLMGAGGPAAERLPGPIPALVVRTLDGDTLQVRARVWLGQEVETLVRLAGVDAPELHGACPAERESAEAARATLQRLVGDGRVTLYDVHFGKYAGRVVARVVTPRGEDLARALAAGGFARAYDGGRRAGWC